MKNIIARMIVIGITVGMSGCASIMNGKKQSVSFNTTPAGATIKASTGESCVTPCILEMRRKNSASLTIEKDGYESQTGIIKKEASWWILGNLWFWPGFLIDLANKSYYELDPDTFNVALVEKSHADNGK